MFNQSVDIPSLRRIAIVGSGISGLTAGLQLKGLGHAVTVFEKSRGPGGRLAAKRVGTASVDIGAQYFTARNPDFLPFLEKYAGKGTFAPWQGRLAYQAPSGEWESFPEETRFVGTPRMTAITRALSANLDVVTETRIARLARTDRIWRLYDTDDVPVGQFDQVIITAPPAQARELLASSGLPEVATELDEPVGKVLPCWAVAAHFPVNPWPHHDGMRCQHPALYWVANNSSKPGRQDTGLWWVLHAGAAWTQKHVDTSAPEVAELLVTAFREVTGFQTGPDDVVAHRWLYARSEGGEQPGHLWYSQHGIGLAGDWLSGGRVEGAFDSACGLVGEMHAESATP